MTSGHDTLLVCNRDGFILRHEIVSGHKWEEESDNIYAPLCFAPLAYSSIGKDFVICLNRLGEILIFKEGKLYVAYRRGKWCFFKHDEYIKEMTAGNAALEPLCSSIYLTMLDVSFSRSGGGIGLLSKDALDSVSLISRDDDLTIDNEIEKNQRDSSKRKDLLKKFFIRTMFGGRTFAEAPRKLRQELVAIDGSTIVLESGEVLCVGAILAVDGGSPDGGGRTAAAQTLARHGLGIKISNDGKITAWRGITKKDTTSLFSVG